MGLTSMLNLIGGNVVVHGVDIVEIATFSRFYDEFGYLYSDQYFTDQEVNSAANGGIKIEKLASRFAVKEAVLKALGVGWGNGVRFVDVEVYSKKNGAPEVILYGKLKKIADEIGVTGWLVSSSHTSNIAMVSVIGVRTPYLFTHPENQE